MKLFLISQTENNGYDTFSDAVVAAPDEETARQMNPYNGQPMVWGGNFSPWCSSPEKVLVEHIGESVEGIKQSVICTSFHAG